MSVSEQTGYLNIDNAHLRVEGNIVAENIELGNIKIAPAHGLSSVTDVGNTTSQTVQFTNAATGLVTTGNVAVGKDLTVSEDLTVSGNVTMSEDLTVSGNVEVGGDMNLLHMANTASIKLNSNVVTEFPRSKKLIKYQRVALTSASQDGYVVTASSTLSTGTPANVPYTVFDESLTTFWHTQYPYYNTSNGSYAPGQTAAGTGTPANGTTLPTNELVSGHRGEWISLELPNKIKLDRLKVVGSTRLASGVTQFPKDVVVAVSDTGLSGSWSVLQTATLTSQNVSNHSVTINITTDVSYYRYFALIVKSINSTATYSATEIAQLELFGIPEYDPDAHGVDVKVKSVPNVPNTDWLEVYYDGRDFSGTPTSITDKSGNNITATANNITIDATYNSFEFTQSPKSNIIADNVTFVSGDEPHSIALWVRLKNGNANNLLFDYRVAGGTSTTGAATGLYILNSNTRLNFYHQNTDKNVDFNFVQNRWYHIVGTYSGGGGFTGSKIFIDGVDVGGVIGGSDADLVLPATGTITIGDYLYNNTYGLGDGSIANVRLFNRDLSQDEVWQLYAYQKEYFGHGDLSMTLKAGRLGIGTSEPKAALDVRGIAKYENVYYYARASTSTNFHNSGIPTYLNVHERSNGGLIVTDSNSSKIQLTTSDADGVYMVWCSVSIESSGSQARGYEVTLRKNGTVFASTRCNINYITGSTYSQVVCSGLIDLVSGDKVHHETSAGFQVHANDTTFYMYRIST